MAKSEKIKDILMKQEGANVGVHFQTEKAKKAFYNSSKKTVKQKIEILSESIAHMVAWAISHDLTIDTQIKIVIHPKE